MKELHSESEDIVSENPVSLKAPDTEDVPVDTAKIQAALEKRVDQETAVLPHLTVPDTDELDASANDSGNSPVSELSPAEHEDQESGKPARKKRRTVRSVSERWWTPSVRSWFFTFMCMNMPIVGWFYLFHEARHEEDPARKEFARAYLFYKLVFFIAGAVVLLILIWIGLGLLDQLLAYMEML